MAIRDGNVGGRVFGMDRRQMAWRRNFGGAHRDRLRLGSRDIHAHSRRAEVEFRTRPNG